MVKLKTMKILKNLSSSLVDVYINDAFSCAHRKQASIQNYQIHKKFFCWAVIYEGNSFHKYGFK